MNKIQFDFQVAGICFRVERFEVTESLSSPFNIKLFLLLKLSDSTYTPIDLDGLMRKPGVLTLFGQESGNEKVFHGDVNEAHYLGEGLRFARYHVSLVPQLWFLTQRQDCRIFQEISVPDILSEVLTLANARDVRFSLLKSYPLRNYVLQYRETDFHFVQRLLAENGMWYYFEHAKSAHTMVIVDSNDAITPLSNACLLFHEMGGGVAEQEHIFELSQINRVRSGSFTYSDYNYEQVDIPQKTFCGGGKYADLALFDYPGRYTNTDLGKEHAPEWMAGHRVESQQISGSSDVMRLATGFSFHIKEHPRKEINQEYTLLSVYHRGHDPQVYEEEASPEQPTTYQNNFTCIARNVVFKAPKMPPPIVDGPQSAVVVGPKDEEIFTDKLGRIKVQFHWDRYGEKNEKSTCWIRVSQSMAGTMWGATFLPRIGHEVIVSFLNGDPDRPLVTGCVYNGLHLPPYPLPEHKTRTTLRTQTHKGTGYNELSFEDEANKEEIYFHAQKNMTLDVLQDRFRNIGQDEFLKVGRHQREEIQGDHLRTVSGDKTTEIKQTLTQTVEQDVNTKYNANETKSVKHSAELSVGDNRSRIIGKNDRLDIGENATLTVGGARLSDISRDDNQTVGGALSVSVKGNVSIKSDAATEIISAETIVLKTGSASLVMKSDGSIKISGSSITLEGTDKVIVKGGKVAINQ